MTNILHPGSIIIHIFIIICCLRVMVDVRGNIAFVNHLRRASLRVTQSYKENPDYSIKLSFLRGESAQEAYVLGLNALDAKDFPAAAQLLSYTYKEGHEIAAGPLALTHWSLGNIERTYDLLNKSDLAYAWWFNECALIPDTKELTSRLEAMVVARPNDIRVNNYLSNVYLTYYENNRADESLDLLEKAVSVRYPSIKAVQLLVRRYINLNRYQDALNIAELVVEKYKSVPPQPNDDALHFVYAQALRASGENDRAIAEYQRAIEKYPESYWYRLEFTEFLLDLGYCNQAIDQYFTIVQDTRFSDQYDISLANQFSVCLNSFPKP